MSGTPEQSSDEEVSPAETTINPVPLTVGHGASTSDLESTDPASADEEASPPPTSGLVLSGPSTLVLPVPEFGTDSTQGIAAAIIHELLLTVIRYEPIHPEDDNQIKAALTVHNARLREPVIDEGTLRALIQYIQQNARGCTTTLIHAARLHLTAPAIVESNPALFGQLTPILQDQDKFNLLHRLIATLLAPYDPNTDEIHGIWEEAGRIALHNYHGDPVTSSSAFSSSSIQAGDNGSPATPIVNAAERARDFVTNFMNLSMPAEAQVHALRAQAQALQEQALALQAQAPILQEQAPTLQEQALTLRAQAQALALNTRHPIHLLPPLLQLIQHDINGGNLAGLTQLVADLTENLDTDGKKQRLKRLTMLDTALDELKQVLTHTISDTQDESTRILARNNRMMVVVLRPFIAAVKRVLEGEDSLMTKTLDWIDNHTIFSLNPGFTQMQKVEALLTLCKTMGGRFLAVDIPIARGLEPILDEPGSKSQERYTECLECIETPITFRAPTSGRSPFSNGGPALLSGHNTASSPTPPTHVSPASSPTSGSAQNPAGLITVPLDESSFRFT